MLGTTIAIGVLQSLRVLANAARAKVIAVLLGPEGVGVVGIVDQVVLVVIRVSALSIPDSALAFLARSFGRGNDAFEQTYLSFLAFLSTLTVVGTTCAVGMVLAQSSLLGENLLRYQPLLIIGLLSVPALAIGGYGENVLAAAQRPRQAVLAATASALVLFLAAAVGLAIGGLTGLFWANLVAGIVIAGAIIGYLHRHLGLPLFERRVRFADELKHQQDLVFYCVSCFLVTTAYPVAWLIARHTVLDRFGEAETGRLQAMVSLMVGYGTLRSINSQLLLPLVSGREDIHRKFHSTVDVQRRLVVVLAVAAMPLVFFPQLLVAVLYSTAFTAASSYLHLFILAEMILILAGTYQALILGLGDTRAWALVYFLGYASLGVMSWVFGRRHGIPGVAVAAIAASSLIFGLALWRLRSRHGFGLPRGLAALLLLVLAMVLGAGMVCAQYADSDGATLLVKVAALLLLVPTLVCCLDSEDRAWISGLVRRQPRSA